MQNFEVDIINYIGGNEKLAQYLGVESIYPLFTTEVNKTSLTYQFDNQPSDGLVNESQLKLRIISKDYDEAKNIEFIIRGFLDMKRNNEYKFVGNTHFRSSLAGGGCLFNGSAQMYENLLIFQITWKER